jgi:hypothetical protein
MLEITTTVHAEDGHLVVESFCMNPKQEGGSVKVIKVEEKIDLGDDAGAWVSITSKRAYHTYLASLCAG